MELKSFLAPSVDQYLALLNDPETHRHMPLASKVDAEWVAAWMLAKHTHWNSSGELGPWSLWEGNEFLGWGGIQQDDEFEAGLAIVLFKHFWGYGLEALQLILHRVMSRPDISQVVIEFPPTRKNADKILLSRGWNRVADGEISGHTFQRYVMRLHR